MENAEIDGEKTEWCLSNKKNFKIMNGNLGIYIKEKTQPGLSILKKDGVKNEWGLSNWAMLNMVF